MKRIFFLLSVAFSLMLVSQAFGEEQTLAGEVSLKGLLVNVNGNKAKFNEYRDLNDGVYGHVKLLYDTDAWWLKANAADIGYDTQNYRIDGGMWGLFKADAFYREIPHNTTFGARSPLTGIGSNNLGFDPATVVLNNPGTWPSSFDFSTKRKQLGGDILLSVLKPFFFDISAMTEQKKGNKPAGAAIAADAIALELPEPVDYRTNTIKADMGYAKNPLFLDVYFMYQDFDNKNDVLNFTNPFLASLGAPAADTLTLPPDNKYYKVGFKGALKLPYNSKLNINTGWSRTTSRADLLTSDAVLGASPLALSDSTFNGKVETTNLNLALTSNPVNFLDGKIFYKYYNRDNKSDVITQVDSVTGTFINRLFDYQKNQYGGELGVRLPMKFYLSAGYSHILTNRPLDTLADTNDDIYNVELRWKGLDFLTVRTGYERLLRNSDFHQPSSTFQFALVEGARNFDLADKTRDTVKLTVDLNPTDFLSFGAGYKHKETNYKQLQFGLKSDRSDEVFANADLAILSYAQIFGYFDYQLTKRNMSQCDTDAAAGLCSADTIWNLKDKETYYDFGVGTNFFLMPKKLTMRLQYDYSRNNGNADLTLGNTLLSNLPAGADQNNIDVLRWDDYRKHTFMTKLIYDVTKRITFSIGYAYEKFKFSDAQLNGYQLVPTDGGAFLTGAYSSQSYNANVYFAAMTYKFW